ncbi:hypothetical protein Salat_2621700 [Sesamum alatum]|uniref:Uncharacterized protein n=1 Tax=Sesamum alatum TaxID=300844 RepID=A0AAE2CAU6_9LAMI|nr:hypothetical protein Salat_2621700 [Sesamum alatum]
MLLYAISRVKVPPSSTAKCGLRPRACVRDWILESRAYYGSKRENRDGTGVSVSTVALNFRNSKRKKDHYLNIKLVDKLLPFQCFYAGLFDYIPFLGSPPSVALTLAQLTTRPDNPKRSIINKDREIHTPNVGESVSVQLATSGYPDRT